MAVAPLTKLEAVNAILADLGDRPVASLSGSLRLDVTQAIATLDHVSRALQVKGWWFNTDIRTIAVNGAFRYVVPTDVSHVEVIDGGPTTGTVGTPHLVVRGLYLFDTVNNTNVFTAATPDVDVQVHSLIDYADLPASAKEYIYAAASIRMQSRTLGSNEIDADLKEQAASALATLQEEELDNTNLDSTYSPHFIRMMHLR